jgi:hypothetical protein
VGDSVGNRRIGLGLLLPAGFNSDIVEDIQRLDDANDLP